jgi:hypothetical protein
MWQSEKEKERGGVLVWRVERMSRRVTSTVMSPMVVWRTTWGASSSAMAPRPIARQQQSERERERERAKCRVTGVNIRVRV